MLKLSKFLLYSFLFWAAPVYAAVAPEYASTTYVEHPLTRSEKRCIDEGYKITYANCSNQTAPADRCPYHDAYYRSCSQEQWCRNNNYTFLADDCKLPTYPTKMCDNKYPMYRACQEDIDKAVAQNTSDKLDKFKFHSVDGYIGIWYPTERSDGTIQAGTNSGIKYTATNGALNKL